MHDCWMTIQRRKLQYFGHVVHLHPSRSYCRHKETWKTMKTQMWHREDSTKIHTETVTEISVEKCHHRKNNTHFLQAGRPSCRPTNSVKALEGNVSHSMDLLTPSSPGGLRTLYLTTNISWLPWGGLPWHSSQDLVWENWNSWTTGSGKVCWKV